MRDILRFLIAVSFSLAATAHATDYFVSTSGSDANSGLTWSDAKASVSNAVDVANAGAANRVIVSNGTYFTAGPIAITSDTRVESVNGPDVTILARKATALFSVCIVSNADAVLAGFTVTNGSLPQSDYGSGVRLANGTVSNCVMTMNYSKRGAAGLYATNGLVTDCRIVNNTDDDATVNTGGARLSRNAVMRNCLIAGNRSDECGGLYLEGGAIARACVISNNTGYLNIYEPAGVYMTASSVLENCLVIDNGGRGVEITTRLTGTPTVRHCTIAGNRHSSNRGCGLRMTVGRVQNTIAYHNAFDAFIDPQNNLERLGGTVSNSCMTPLVTGGGNTAAEPRFAQLAGRNLRLMPGSPAIDGGLAAGVATDIGGAARPVDGNGDGTPAADMGAYEAADGGAGALRCGFVAAPAEGIDTLDVTFSAAFAGADTNIVFTGWDFGDGVATGGTDLASVTHAFGPGFYTAILTASNASGETATATVSNAVRVGPSTAFVSPAGSHTHPFDTWQKAARSLQAAVDAVVAAGGAPVTVWVTNGSYFVTSSVQVVKGIAIRGVNGPDVTVVARTSGSTRVFYVIHPAALISGLSMTNGSYGGQEGSGLYLQGGTATNCIIERNQQNRASAVYVDGGLVTHSVIRRNTDAGNSGTSGGASLVNTGRLAWCTIAGNTGGSEVSSVAAVRMGGNCIVRNCIITNNASSGTGTNAAAVRMSAGDVVQNCLIASNQVRGIVMAGGTARNCTVTRNTVTGNAAPGIAMSTGLVRNCVVYANGDNSGNLTAGSGAVDYTCVTPAVPGAGNSSLDPLLVDPAGDYRLGDGSPGLDSGTNESWMTGEADLAGADRVINGTVDRGAYEKTGASGGPLACNFSAPVTEALTNLPAVFTAVVSGDDTSIVSYAWDFGDGQSDSGADRTNVSHAYTTGYFTVTLTVNNMSGEAATNTKAAYIRVAPLIAHVSPYGAHVAPFASWNTAATTVQAAVDAALVQGADATSVLITDGTYRVTQNIEISKAITVRSVNGRDRTTIIRPSTAPSCRIFWIHHPAAVLDGVTITNGYRTGSGQTGGIQLDGGTVRNCTVAFCQGDREAGGIALTAGTVSNCVVRGNSDTGNSGTLGGVSVLAGQVIDCLIVANRGGSDIGAVGGLRMSGGEVRSCVIASNVYGTGAAGAAGGAHVSGGVLRGCLVHANSGAGVRLSAGSVVNATIVRNSGIGLTNSVSGVTNTIAWFNGGADISGVTAGIRSSCSPSLPHDPLGAGTITSDPQFLASGSGTGTNAAGDYHIRARSPCANAGLLQGWMSDAHDIDGNPRVRGAQPDMGAYEAPPARNGLLVVTQ